VALLLDLRLCDRFLEGLNVEEIQQEARSHHIQKGRPPTSGDLPLSKETRQAIVSAGEDADKLGQRFVDNEHILLGILSLQNCFATEILWRRGLSADKIRARMKEGDGPSG
jgi:ATP-dependent Clp protease ATP-binding subunit ClpA